MATDMKDTMRELVLKMQRFGFPGTPHPTSISRRVGLSFLVGLMAGRDEITDEMGPEILGWLEYADSDDLQFVFTGEVTNADAS